MVEHLVPYSGLIINGLLRSRSICIPTPVLGSSLSDAFLVSLSIVKACCKELCKLFMLYSSKAFLRRMLLGHLVFNRWLDITWLPVSSVCVPAGYCLLLIYSVRHFCEETSPTIRLNPL